MFFFLFFTSCSGYHFSNNTNPLRIYDIESVAVPFFLNQSSLVGISGPMTREISGLLASYTGLRVIAGESSKADAHLIGIISSDHLKREVVKVTAQRPADGDLLESLGSRRVFYLPSSKHYTVHLRLVLIKNPSPSEIEIITSDKGRFLKGTPKVIFDEELLLQYDISNVLFSNRTSDEGGVVSLTQNKALERSGMEELAKQACTSFKQEILDAF